MVPFPPFFLASHQLIDLLILVLNHSWSFWLYVLSIFCLCNIINKMFIVLFSRHFVNTSWFVGKYKSVLLCSYFLISGDSILWNFQFILLNSMFLIKFIMSSSKSVYSLTLHWGTLPGIRSKIFFWRPI